MHDLPSGSSPPALDYDSTPRRKNTLALAALLVGMMLFIPLASGVLAILLGRRAMRDARDYALGRAGIARTAIVLGVINVVCWLALMPVYIVHQRREAERLACRLNLQSVVRAMGMYSNDDRGYWPTTFDQLVKGKYLALADRAFACPACAADSTRNHATVSNLVKSDFIIAGPWNPMPPPEEMKYVGDGPNLVLAWEPISNHGGTGMNIFTVRGGAKWIPRAIAVKVDAELRAGLNPPPSLDADAARRIAWMATTQRAAATSRATGRSEIP